MSNSEKATALLSYLDGLDSKSVINILHPFIENDVLATEYDRFVEEGLIEEQKKKGRLIAIYFESDSCYNRLTDEYQNLDLDSFVSRAKILYPEIIRKDDIAEIEGEIENESERYILTGEDHIEYCVRIYERI